MTNPFTPLEELQKIGRYGIYLVAALVIVYLTFIHVADSRRLAAAERLAAAVTAKAAKGRGFTEATVATEKKIAGTLSPQLAQDVAAVKAVDKTVQPIGHASSTVSIKDTANGSVTAKQAGPAFCPALLQDEYGRFSVTVPTNDRERPIFSRSQLFKFDAVVIKRLNGTAMFVKSEFREYKPGQEPSPETEIPVEGAKIASDIEILTESAAPVKPFHPRAVFAADARGQVGGGVEVLNFKDKLNLSLLGYYSPSAHGLDAGAQLGYRLRFPFLDTNISIGPTYTFRQRLGVGVTLQLTR